MTVLRTTPDTEANTLTIEAEFAAPPERVWQVWSDPRQLERWWGPPTWPATFTEHDLVPGGRMSYYMTGPNGEKAGGWWKILTVEEPTLIEFEDGFADDAGVPDPSMPITRARVTFTAVGQGTRMTIVSSFADAAQMQQLLQMGMDEGMSLAMGQIDALLAA